ncbi:MAG: hypothetical protein KDM63_12205 [Verrucomicrobiae bacterium]|nr:hypothetical protein [Verrucomicrobiae bacterium]
MKHALFMAPVMVAALALMVLMVVVMRVMCCGASLCCWMGRCRRDSEPAKRA